MAQGYAKSTLTLAAATAQRLSDLLAAEGYTGRMLGKFLRIHPGALTDVFRGTDNTVSATTGVPVTSTIPYQRESNSPQAVIDPGNIWLFSTAGGDVQVTFESF